MWVLGGRVIEPILAVLVVIKIDDLQFRRSKHSQAVAGVALCRDEQALGLADDGRLQRHLGAVVGHGPALAASVVLPAVQGFEGGGDGQVVGVPMAALRVDDIVHSLAVVCGRGGSGLLMVGGRGEVAGGYLPNSRGTSQMDLGGGVGI